MTSSERARKNEANILKALASLGQAHLGGVVQRGQGDRGAQAAEGGRGVEDDLSAVLVQGLGDDRQAEAAAFDAGAQFAVEAVEDALARFFGNAGAGVFEARATGSVVGPRRMQSAAIVAKPRSLPPIVIVTTSVAVLSATSCTVGAVWPVSVSCGEVVTFAVTAPLHVWSVNSIPSEAATRCG